MGWISIPDPVPGETVVTGEWDRGELQEVVRRLTAAVASLTSGSRPSAEPAAWRPSPLTQADTQEYHPTYPQGGQPSIPQANAAAARAAPPSEPFDAQKVLLEKIAAGLKKPNAADKARPTAALSPGSVPVPAANGTKLKWKECWRTEADDHSNDAVQAMAYAPLLDGLPGGDGHGGWLVSASKNLLNLWECNAGRGEATLQVMHSQMTEYKSADLELERDTQLLMSASRETSRTHAECISLHSLSPEAGMFAPRGRLPLPPKLLADPVVRENPPEHPQALQVESLHKFGGPLAGCAAASFKNYITIYPATGTAGTAANAKTTWQAHEGFVTQLHASAYSIDLFSAALDGTVNRWELRAKPRQPAAQFVGLPGEVTGLQQVSDQQLLAASAEGQLSVWDLRRSDSPLRLVPAPDGRGITKLAYSPEQRLAAFATSSGNVCSLDLSETACTTAALSSKRLQTPVRALLWNTRTHHLMAASGSSIVVYSRQP